MTLQPVSTDYLWPAYTPGDELAPEPDLEPEVGATVMATAVRHIVRRVGRDRFGEPVYRSRRVEYTAVGYITSINLEDECSIRYFDEVAGRWSTGVWHADDLSVIYPAIENAAA